MIKAALVSACLAAAPSAAMALTVHHLCSHYADLCREDAKAKQADEKICDADLEKARAAKTGEENVGRWPEPPQRYCWKKDL